MDRVQQSLVIHHLCERVEYKVCAESDLPIIFTRLHVTSRKCCRFDLCDPEFIIPSLCLVPTSFRHDAPNDPYF